MIAIVAIILVLTAVYMYSYMLEDITGDQAVTASFGRQSAPANQPLRSIFVQCSTDIYFSPGKEEKTPPEEAQRIIFAAIYFENTTKSIMLTHWKARRFFESKMKEQRTTRVGQFDITMMQVRKEIREKKSIEDLHDLVCHDKDAYKRAKGVRNKNFEWNLKGIDYETIEFRQLPVSRSAEDADDWVGFTAAFIRAALTADTEDLDKAAESGTTAALNALFNLGGSGLTGRPAEEAHL
ncbi:hypothetical protein DL766_005684 [Monosporascus sp. MC13-8B]|uniref:Uncharacterized protein n=1 Tax=Monosporascus cannonballus TaxID=155416 RepID=A0ABY0HI57_9PEZI|nr:hypothetical protein DL762_001277 [Monosporascus cannonballus]RYO99710.1 hypothetical protein DL763_001318 [Monosporascus cannonballus]RYP28770.1 hypothetical protein DL766_005684 [Monosporascus sp. MC13-8B]